MALMMITVSFVIVFVTKVDHPKTLAKFLLTLTLDHYAGC